MPSGHTDKKSIRNKPLTTSQRVYLRDLLVVGKIVPNSQNQGECNLLRSLVSAAMLA
jgi:hypothetical protein